jgi:heme oxygenase
VADAAALDIHAPIEHLRRATRDLHKKLEDDLDVVGELSSEPARSRLLTRYHAFHGGADAILSRWISGTAGLEDLSRAVRLRLDRSLVTRLSPPSDQVSLPTVESREEALGVLYVVEGSALGGKLILRQLAARGADVSELGFLDPHGEQAGPVWRRFLEVLERELSGSEESIAAAVAGAVKGFVFARCCLVEAVEVV